MSDAIIRPIVQQLIDAAEEGRAARRRGAHPEDNPHDESSRLHEAWISGFWTEARQQLGLPKESA